MVSKELEHLTATELFTAAVDPARYGPDSTVLAIGQELVAIRWRATSDGKIQIEPKEELKNRLGRSPDRADAVVPAFSGWTPCKARSTEAVHWR